MEELLKNRERYRLIMNIFFYQIQKLRYRKKQHFNKIIELKTFKNSIKTLCFSIYFLYEENKVRIIIQENIRTNNISREKFFLFSYKNYVINT